MSYHPKIPALPSRAWSEGVCMFSFLIGLAIAAMILGPAILIAIQNARSREHDL